MQQQSLKEWSFHLRYTVVEEQVASNAISHLRLKDVPFEIEKKDKLGGTTGVYVALVP